MNATDFTAILDTYYDIETEYFDWIGYLSSKEMLSAPGYNKKDANLPYFVMANKRETVAILVIAIEAEDCDNDYTSAYSYYIVASMDGDNACDLLDKAEECGIPIEKNIYSTMLARMIHGIDGGGEWVVPELYNAMNDWYSDIRFEDNY